MIIAGYGTSLLPGCCTADSETPPANGFWLDTHDMPAPNEILRRITSNESDNLPSPKTTWRDGLSQVDSCDVK